eukprot:7519838-Alexandrium_andersonii.AAC.1
MCIRDRRGYCAGRCAGTARVLCGTGWVMCGYCAGTVRVLRGYCAGTVRVLPEWLRPARAALARHWR